MTLDKEREVTRGQSTPGRLQDAAKGLEELRLLRLQSRERKRRWRETIKSSDPERYEELKRRAREERRRTRMRKKGGSQAPEGLKTPPKDDDPPQPECGPSSPPINSDAGKGRKVFCLLCCSTQEEVLTEDLMKILGGHLCSTCHALVSSTLASKDKLVAKEKAVRRIQKLLLDELRRLQVELNRFTNRLEKIEEIAADSLCAQIGSGNLLKLIKKRVKHCTVIRDLQEFRELIFKEGLPPLVSTPLPPPTARENEEQEAVSVEMKQEPRDSEEIPDPEQSEVPEPQPKSDMVPSRPRPFECEFCDKRFLRRHHLVDHRRRHTGEKPYFCGVCGKAFVKSESLKAHKLTHIKEEIKVPGGGPSGSKRDLMPCPFGCGKSFSRKKRGLRAHLRLYPNGSCKLKLHGAEVTKGPFLNPSSGEKLKPLEENMESEQMEQEQEIVPLSGDWAAGDDDSVPKDPLALE